jgi:hypothetical protein
MCARKMITSRILFLGRRVSGLSVYAQDVHLLPYSYCRACGSLLLIELNPTCICIAHRYFPKTIAEGEADVLCAGEDMTTHYVFTLDGLHLVIVTCVHTVVVRVCTRERRRQFSSHFNLINNAETLFLSGV